VHHRYQPPTAFSAVAFHPVEFAVYVIGGQILFWFVPLHPVPAAIVGGYTSYYLIEDHSGIKRTPIWPWQPTSKYHDDHHRYFHCNFGQHILLFDQLGGTLRQEARKYSEDIFGGKGKVE
jgi:lathosterol oxidase